MGKIYLFSLLFVFLLLISFKNVYAQSSYVLPYPSFMPGNVLYKPHLFLEKITKIWYFGSFGEYDYSLKESGSYLVEAKTLFNYKQYLLGYKALQKSDDYFVKIPQALLKAKNENKDIGQKEKALKEASLKHIEILSSVKLELPKTFIWAPEKSSSTTLLLEDAVNKSIKIRENSL